MSQWFRSTTFKAAVLFLIPLSLSIAVALFPRLPVPDTLKHLFLTLTAVTGVHLLDRVVLFRETYAALKAITDGIEKKVGEQTESLTRTSASLQAMIAAGISRLYSGREDAAHDMGRDLTDLANTSIRLIGISLNDFIRADEPTLAETWSQIRRFIEEDRALDTKLLLIDPDCFGAHLRSRGEARTEPPIAGRLSEDVRAAAESLLALERIAASKQHVRFECRFYRLAPILFLCQVDSASYVQQYYFWSQRKASRSSPVIRFRRTESPSDARLMHEGMRDHFDWVWEYGSIPISDILKAKSIGTEKGVQQSGIVNVFASVGEGLDRILWLLDHAKDTVWIQGISLQSFFEPGPVFNAIVTLIKDGKVDLRVLVIDSESEQAKYRSYRERLFAHHDLSFEDYLASGQHMQSDLFRDTERSIENLRGQVTALRRKLGDAWQPRLRVRKYATAPGCFMLRVDDTVLAEQYHYGKVVPAGQEAPSILGKDMPLVEYRPLGSPIYPPVELRNPFSLLRDHFEFAFARGLEVNVLRSGDDSDEVRQDKLRE